MPAAARRAGAAVLSVGDCGRRYAEKDKRRVVGLMSGTSLDGIDAALVRVSGSGRETRAHVDAFLTCPLPDPLRALILDISHGRGNAETVSRLHVALGVAFADAALAVLAEARVSAADIDLVASHGQTVSHTPPRGGASERGATLQIGEPSVIAQALGAPVVSDFRAADVAAGGQGAPLVPYADWCLLTHPSINRAVQNIGGIGNVTYLPADAAPDDVIGFDTGPGNMLIDRAAQWCTGGSLRFDRDGRLAAIGSVDTSLLDWLMEHPFLAERPPKSAGREEFGELFWREALERFERAGRRRPEDLVATFTAWTARTIAASYARYLPASAMEVVVGGGGAMNPVLIDMLKELLGGSSVIRHEQLGIDGNAKEALAFAILGNEMMLGRQANLPSVTGASHPVTLGKLTMP